MAWPTSLVTTPSELSTRISYVKLSGDSQTVFTGPRPRGEFACDIKGRVRETRVNVAETLVSTSVSSDSSANIIILDWPTPATATHLWMTAQSLEPRGVYDVIVTFLASNGYEQHVTYRVDNIDCTFLYAIPPETKTVSAFLLAHDPSTSRSQIWDFAGLP